MPLPTDLPHDALHAAQRCLRWCLRLCLRRSLRGCLRPCLLHGLRRCLQPGLRLRLAPLRQGGLALACTTTLLPLWAGMSGCTLLQPDSAPAPPATVVFVPPPLPVPAPPPPPAPPREPSAADLADAAARRLLAFSERVRDLPPADLAREQQRLSEGPLDPASTLELVLLLGQGRPNGDLQRALTLVEPLARNSAPAPWQALARLLQNRLTDQRRLEEQVERQGQQLRDQQRRIDQLGSQLEALKAIERSLNTRPPGAPAPGSRGGTP